jgi:hypothetical protein
VRLEEMTPDGAVCRAFGRTGSFFTQDIAGQGAIEVSVI